MKKISFKQVPKITKPPEISGPVGKSSNLKAPKKGQIVKWE